MTYPASPDPFPGGPADYYSASPQSDPAKHIRLTIIFNTISASLDLIGVLIVLGLSLFFALVPDPDPTPGDPPMWVLSIIYGVWSIFPLSASIVKFIAVRKLKIGAPNAHGWSLAAGIVGTCQLLCGNCCFAQPAAGIYTIVAVSMGNVRTYLGALQNQQPPEVY